jgi:isopenicillin-N N-acyltransferase-like protein
MGLPYLKLAGTPEEIGEAYGEEVKDMIASNISLYFDRFENEAGLPRQEVLERAGRYLEVMKSSAPDYVAMMKSIARSSGTSFADIVALNVRYEILYSAYSVIGMEEAEGSSLSSDCTALAISRGLSADGHLRIAQNWDWIPGVECVLAEVSLSSGTKVICLNEAGIAGGKIGLNSSGLGLLVNGLLSNLDDWSRLGEPFHVKTWKVLCSSNLEEAVRVISSGSHPCSANFLVAQSLNGEQQANEIVDVEIYPGGEVVLAVGDGYFVHANHFLDPDSIGIWQPFREDCLTTFNRYSRMVELLKTTTEKNGTITKEFIYSALSDHDRKPDSICRHRNTSLKESEQIRTVLSVLIDLDSRTMEVAPGPPCLESYTEYRLDE